MPYIPTEATLEIFPRPEGEEPLFESQALTEALYRIEGNLPEVCQQLAEDFEQSATERDLAILREIEQAGNGWEKRQRDTCFRRTQSKHYAIAGWHHADRGRWQVWTPDSDLSRAEIQGTASGLDVSLALGEANAALEAELSKLGRGRQSLLRKLLDSIV